MSSAIEPNRMPIHVIAWVLAAALAHATWNALLKGRAGDPFVTMAGLAITWAIALWAFARAPVASVAALRETSVLFGAVIAAVFLRERFGPRRVAGALLVALGAVLLRLAS